MHWNMVACLVSVSMLCVISLSFIIVIYYHPIFIKMKHSPESGSHTMFRDGNVPQQYSPFFALDYPHCVHTYT